VQAIGNTVEKNATDQIWLVKSATGQTAVNATRANTLVSDSNAPTAGVENNMPTWAPTPGPDVQWIAFASKRDYGFVLCSPTGTTSPVCTTTSKIGSGMQQIWIAAVDVSKLGTGADPTYPAFRVPFTDLTENCHRPFWALDALKPDGDAGVADGGATDSGAGSGDAGNGDAGAFDAGACVTFGSDCSSGYCCSGLQCLPNGSAYSCMTP
jgi:hypothetical protein